MKIRALVLSAAATGAVLAHAPAAMAAACRYAAAGYADGCATAPVQGVYRQATFGTYARQSGQKWTAAHPQPWDVAGWDYAVGYSQHAARGMYPLVAPDLATAGGAGAGTNLPFTTAANGCVYTATGNPIMPGFPAVVCRGQLPNNGTGAYAGQPVISGINFAADRAGDCVQLYIDLNTTQTVYVVNNNFKKGATCYVANATSTDALVNVISSPVSLVLKYNMFNGLAPYLQDEANLVVMNGSGTLDAEYNAFLNPSARPMNGDAHAGWTVKYNYFDGIGIGVAAPHGELTGAFPNADFAVIAYHDLEFNTAVWGANTVGVNGVNAGVFMSGGGNGQTLALGKILNNTLVSNMEYGGKVSSGKVLLSVEIPYVGALIVQNNFVDPSGSWLCMQVEGDEIGIAGYVDDGQGPAGAYDGVAGNVLHVTARVGKDFILPGAQLLQSQGVGFPGSPAVLGGAGYVCNGVTMTGATNSTVLQTAPYDTYCVSGSPQAVAAFTGVQTMPQIQASTISGNINLRDRSAITQGATAQWNGGACNGKF